MRYLAILLLALCPAPLLAQKTESDQQTLQALLSEVRELRLAIERSTLLGTRAQIALSRLQTQEEKAARLSQQLAEAHKQASEIAVQRAERTERIKRLESDLATVTLPQQRAEMEANIKQIKFETEQLAVMEQDRAARESEAANQFQAAQNEVNDARARITEMERALDAAIQQMLKPR